MTSAAIDRRNRRINAFQLREIERLASEPAFARQASRRAHYSRIGDWLGEEAAGDTLELGCGPGRFVAMLASLGHRVTGVDPLTFPSWETIRAHRTVTLQSGVFAEALPFPDASFDNLACLAAILYFADVDKAFTEMRRVTKPRGRAVIRTVMDRHLYTRMTGRRFDPAAHNYFTEASLRETLERHGFDVRAMSTYGFAPPCWSTQWWALVNGRISIDAQEALSALMPRDMRLSVTAFAIRT